LNYASVTVFESGSGTDFAHLNSAAGGGDIFTNTPTVSSLTGNGMTITVNTFMLNGSQQIIALPSQIAVIANGLDQNDDDTFNLYDGNGANSIVASGNNVAYSNALSSVTLSLNPSSTVAAYQQNGDDDSVDVGSIDFALQAIGDWTSV
jgi:hypothetical protein